MKSLQNLEGWIAQLVEEPFVRLFADRLLSQDVAAHLIRAMEDGEQMTGEGEPTVPGRYRILLHPEDLAALRRKHPHVEQDLASALTTVVAHMRLRLRQAPAVELVADRRTPPRSVRIEPLDGHEPVEERTRDLDLSRLQKEARMTNRGTKSAYLVIEGRRVFDLSQPLTCIGRALDNDLILEDPRISRYHAQLHLRHGRHVLQDLDSTGGTRVNGQPVQETVLHSGDLISLAGVTLLYVMQHAGESVPKQRNADEETRPTPSEGSE
ncbi:MAG: FhaA domain-containing protein [Anaerolineae bacterium]